jgi:hypothetical protein
VRGPLEIVEIASIGGGRARAAGALTDKLELFK